MRPAAPIALRKLLITERLLSKESHSSLDSEFQFGHPRESAVKRIEGGTTTNRQPPATVITMDAVRSVQTSHEWANLPNTDG